MLRSTAKLPFVPSPAPECCILSAWHSSPHPRYSLFRQAPGQSLHFGASLLHSSVHPVFLFFLIRPLFFLLHLFLCTAVFHHSHAPVSLNPALRSARGKSHNITENKQSRPESEAAIPSFDCPAVHRTESGRSGRPKRSGQLRYSTDGRPYRRFPQAQPVRQRGLVP